VRIDHGGKEDAEEDAVSAEFNEKLAALDRYTAPCENSVPVVSAV
jgi:hypothetical protein